MSIQMHHPMRYRLAASGEAHGHGGTRHTPPATVCARPSGRPQGQAPGTAVPPGPLAGSRHPCTARAAEGPPFRPMADSAETSPRMTVPEPLEPRPVAQAIAPARHGSATTTGSPGSASLFCTRRPRIMGLAMRAEIVNFAPVAWHAPDSSAR